MIELDATLKFRLLLSVLVGGIGIACTSPSEVDPRDLSGRWLGSGGSGGTEFRMELAQHSDGSLQGVAEATTQFAYRVTGRVTAGGGVTMQLTDTVFVSIGYEFAGRVDGSGQRMTGELLQGGMPAPFAWSRDP